MCMRMRVDICMHMRIGMQNPRRLAMGSTSRGTAHKTPGLLQPQRPLPSGVLNGACVWQSQQTRIPRRCTFLRPKTPLFLRPKTPLFLSPKTQVAGAMRNQARFRKSAKRCRIVFFVVGAFQRCAICLVWTMSY